MTFNLGIELGEARVCAAVERGGTMRMVSFGGTRAMPFAVHVGRDGTIRAGHDALDAATGDPAGVVADLAARLEDPKSVVVNGYASTGESLVAHLLAHVLDQARAQVAGEALGEVVLAVPPSWPPARRAALLAAAAQAGLGRADAVLAPRAASRAPESAQRLPEQAPALGAAVLAVQRARGAGRGAPSPGAGDPGPGDPDAAPTGSAPGGSAPTGSATGGSAPGADDVPATRVLPAASAASAGAAAAGAAARPRPPARPAAPLPTERPTSVFDATDPAASRGRLAAAGGAGGGPLGGGGGGFGGGGDGADGPGDAGGRGRGGRGAFVAAGIALVVLLVVLVVVLATRDRGSGDAATTGSTGSTGAVTSTSSTTVATTSTSTTTTSTTTTSTTTTTRPTGTSTTSTTVVAPAKIGPVALADTGLVLQFGSASSFTLRFGDDVDGVLTRVAALAGTPTSDTGWAKVELCVGDETRRVTFGDLELVFTKNAAGAPSGSRTFQQWFVDSPGKKPEGLVTLDRIGIGSTVADLKKVYGDALKVVQPIPGDPSGLFTTSSSSNFIDGITSGTTSTSFVKQMWAGTACQRVAD